MKAGIKPASSPSADRVAITGLGAVCSLGHSIPQIVESFLSGKSGASEITGFDAAGFGCLAAQVKNLPAFKTDVPPQLALTMGKHLSLLMASVDEALRGAGIAQGMFAPEDMGFFAGMGMVDYHVEDLLPAVLKSLNRDGDIDYDKFFLEGYREIYPLWPLGMLNNVAFCQASIHFGLNGENSVFCPHGDGGVMAVQEAACVLLEGRAKMALAGGVSEEISVPGLARARLKGLLGPSSELGAQEAFLGESGAMLVLEPLAQARGRGASIRGQIAGFGFSCERGQKGRFASRQAISSAMRAALFDAGFAPAGIDLVMLGSLDENELEAVREVFDGQVEPPVIVAAPAAVGETFAAGPALNAAIALAMPDDAQVPRNCRPKALEGASKGLHTGRRVLVNGISCEGGCGSMIVEGANTR